MSRSSWWLGLLVFGLLVVLCGGSRQCVSGVIINVILLEDQESPWSLKYVKREILEAIEEDSAINAAEGRSNKNSPLYSVLRI